jgi:hypothetical protein
LGGWNQICCFSEVQRYWIFTTSQNCMYHTILRRNSNIVIPLWNFCRRPVFAIKLKNWLNPTRDPELQFWVLLFVTNKNHGQPLIQYAKIVEPFLMGASYHPEEVPLKKRAQQSWHIDQIKRSHTVGIFITSSYVYPVGFFCGGNYFVFPQIKP